MSMDNPISYYAENDRRQVENSSSKLDKICDC